MKIRDIVDLATDRPAYGVTVGVLTLVLLVLTWRAVRRALAGHRPENVLTLAAASVATSVQGTGMWRFFGVTLGADGPLRILLFSFIEIAQIVEALRARRNVIESEDHSAGVDGVAVWVLAGLSAVLSSMDARSFPEAVFRLAVPLVAAWLWERLMAVERRRAKGRRIHWRFTPERALVRLGLAEAADRTASEVDAHRRLTRVALASQRLRGLRATGGRARRLRRAERRLDATMRAAIEHTAITDDEDSQEALLSQIGALVHARSLADLVPPAPWDRWEPPVVEPPADDLGPDPFTDDEISEQLLAWFKGEDIPAVLPAPDPHQVHAARAFADEVRAGRKPGIKRIKRTLRIGQDRAYEVQAYLGTLADARTVPAGR